MAETIDDVDEVLRLRDLAVAVIRARLAPFELLEPEPVIRWHDAAGVLAAMAELAARFVRGNAAAIGTTPEDVISRIVAVDDARLKS